MEKAALSRFHNQDLWLSISLLTSGLLLLSGVVLLAVSAPAQTPPMNLKSRIFLIEQELQPRLGPVRLHRLESLEDDIFTPTLGSTNVESPFLVYRVEQRRFFVK